MCRPFTSLLLAKRELGARFARDCAIMRAALVRDIAAVKPKRLTFYHILSML